MARTPSAMVRSETLACFTVAGGDVRALSTSQVATALIVSPQAAYARLENLRRQSLVGRRELRVRRGTRRGRGQTYGGYYVEWYLTNKGLHLMRATVVPRPPKVEQTPEVWRRVRRNLG